MKRVLFVANVAKEHIIKFHIPTIKRLSEHGWIVDVACGGKEEVPFCHKQYILPIDRSPFKTHFFKGVHQLKQLLKTEHYDIVYCHTSVGFVVAKIASIGARRQGTKVVHFAHGTYFYEGAPLINWILFYPLFKILSFVTDATITITKEDFHFSCKHFSHAKTYYVPGVGVDPSRFRIESKQDKREEYRLLLNIPPNTVVLIYLAEISKNKNQVLLIDALDDILKTKENVMLVLPGNDCSNGEVERYARSKGLIDKVLFLGWRNDAPFLLNMADIYTASSIREGLGLNIIEAMICDLPVIATNNSGHREIIQDGENGFLVSTNNPHLYAQKVLGLIGNIKLRETLVQKAKNNIERYYLESVLDQIESILNEQLSN